MKSREIKDKIKLEKKNKKSASSIQYSKVFMLWGSRGPQLFAGAPRTPCLPTKVTNSPPFPLIFIQCERLLQICSFYVFFWLFLCLYIAINFLQICVNVRYNVWIQITKIQVNFNLILHMLTKFVMKDFFFQRETFNSSFSRITF